MIGAGADAASLVLNLLGAVSALAFVLHRGGDRDGPVDRRLAILFRVLIALFLVRAMGWAFEASPLRRIEEAIAATLPLCALILAEGLLRRHAPRMLKLAAAGGAIVFGLIALARPAFAAPYALAALGVFVAGMLAAVAVLILLRDRESLSLEENRVISGLGLGLVIAAPLAATDFLTAADRAEFGLGGLGLVVFVFAVTAASAGARRASGIALDLVVAVAAAFALAASSAMIFGAPEPSLAAPWAAVALGLTLTIGIVQRLRENAVRDRDDAFFAMLAAAPDAGLTAFLDHVLDAPDLRAAAVLDADALAAYDLAALAAMFNDRPVVAATDVARVNAPGAEQTAALLETYAMTHAVRLSEAPLSLMLVQAPALSSGDALDARLALVARLARSAASAGP